MLLLSLGLLGLATTALAAALPQDISILPEVPCPFATGDEVVVDNNSFGVQCSQAYTTPSLGAYTVQRTFDACLARCGDTPRCVAVNYNTVDRKCELKAELGPTVTSPLTFAAELLRGVNSNEEGGNELVERQQLDGPVMNCLFKTDDLLVVQGKPYRMKCRLAYDGPYIGTPTEEPTFGYCLARCGSTAGCVAANWNLRDSECSLSKLSNSTVNSPWEWAAALVSDGLHPDGSMASDSTTTFNATAPFAQKSIAELAKRQSDACPFTFEDILIVEDQYYQVNCDTAFDSAAVGGITTQPTFEACLARCGNTPRCTAANYNLVDHKCTLVAAATGAVARPFTYAAQRAPVSLLPGLPLPPPKRDLAASANSEASCPYNAGQTYHAGGYSYRVQCRRRIALDAEGVNTAGDIFTDVESCLEFCGSVGGCNGVSFTPGDGWCWFFASAADTEEDELSWVGELIRDAAPVEEGNELVQRQTPEPVIPCPFAANDVVSISGVSYRRYYDRQLYGKSLGAPRPETFEACVEACSRHGPACTAVTWHWTPFLFCELMGEVGWHGPTPAKWSAHRIDASKPWDDPVLPDLNPADSKMPESTGAARAEKEVNELLARQEVIPVIPCPFADDDIISAEGVSYRRYCDRDFYGPPFAFSLTPSTFEGCLGACSNLGPRCKFISFDFTSVKCSFFEQTGGHGRKAAVWAAERIEEIDIAKGGVQGPIAGKRKEGVPHPLSEPRSADREISKLLERQTHDPVPFPPDSPLCPWTDHKPFGEWSAGGFTYRLSCDTVYKYDGGLGHKDDISFKECLALCSTLNDCRAVSYEPRRVPERCSLWASTQESGWAWATWTAVRLEWPDDFAPVTTVTPVAPLKRQVVPEDVQPDVSFPPCPWANVQFIDYPNIEVRPEHWDVYCNAHWEGGILIDDFGVADFSGCVVLCHYTQGCVAFTWLGPNSSSNCVIHNADAKFVNGGWGVAIKKTEGAPHQELPFA